MADKRLGRGLADIWGDGVESVIDDIQDGKNPNFLKRQMSINVKDIKPNPYQPRKTFDEKALIELSESIKEHGIFTALIVRKNIRGYELIAGERRLRAAKMANFENVPCVVVDFDDKQMMEISILENIQREDLNPIEEAKAYKSLIDKLDYTQENLAKRVGKTREYCANILRLLKLPKIVQEMVISKKLSTSSARSLISIEDENHLIELAKKIVKEGLSVREVEKVVKGKNIKPVKEKSSDLLYVENLIKNKLSTEVNLSKNSINIKYSDIDDLNRILEVLNLIEE